MGWFSKKKDPPKEEQKPQKKEEDNNKRSSINQNKNQEQPDDLAMQYQTNQDQFLIDSILQYVTSPVFNTPVIDFMDENCILFQDSSKESMTIYADIHLNFKACVEQHMQILQETIGQDKKSLFNFIQSMLQDQSYQKYLKIMILYYHLGEFTKVMIHRNKKLEEMAKSGKTPENPAGKNEKRSDQKKYESVSKEDMNFVVKQSVLDEQNKQDRQKALKQREDEEYERAILESKKWYEDYLRRLEQEEEDLRRALLLSLEYMRQQGIKENEADKKERFEQERKLQEEKERAKQEIKRLELENQRLQDEKLRKLQLLNEQGKISDLQQSQLMKTNEEKLLAIELERQRQKKLEEEERRLREQNEKKQRELLQQSEDMKRKILENQERVRKMKEEEQLKKKQLEDEQERIKANQLKSEQKAQQNESNKKEQANQRLMGAIKQQLLSNDKSNNSGNKAKIGDQQKVKTSQFQNNLEQELGYNYDDNNDQNDIMFDNDANYQRNKIIGQNNLLIVDDADDDNTAQQKAGQKKQQQSNNNNNNNNNINNNNNNYSSINNNSNNQDNYSSNNPNANNKNNNTNTKFNKQNNYNSQNKQNDDNQFENDGDDNLDDNSSSNPYKLNPKSYDQNVRANFFAELAHDSALKSQLASKQNLKPANNTNQQKDDLSSEEDDDDQYKSSKYRKNKLEDQFEGLYKDINDLDLDQKYGREQLDDSRKYNKQSSGGGDDLYNSISKDDSNQRRERAAQQRAELLKIRKQQRDTELQSYQSVNQRGFQNGNSVQNNNNGTYNPYGNNGPQGNIGAQGNVGSQNNIGSLGNIGNNGYDNSNQYQQSSQNQNANGMYGGNRQNGSIQQISQRDESYSTQKDQKIPIKFSDIGKATIANRTQF